MSNSVIPEQKVFLNAFEGNIFDFDNVNSKVYLTRKINTMMTIFGPNCIMDGFDIYSYSLDFNLNFVVNISGGKIIVDSTLIEYVEPTTLTLNLLDFDSSGKLAVMIGYNYLDTAYSNLSKISIKYINPGNICNNFIKQYDNLVLGTFTFDKNSFIATLTSDEFVTINNTVFPVRPPNKINKSFYDYMNNMLGI